MDLIDAWDWAVGLGVFFVLPVIVGGKFAAAKGYTPWVGWILGLCLSLLGLLVVFLLPDGKARARE